MKRLRMCMAAALMSTAALMTASQAIAETVLRFADYSANRGTRAKEQVWFAEELSRRTEGRLKVEFHWGGALVGATNMLDGVSSGVASMGAVTAAYFPQQLYSYGVGDLTVRVPDEYVSSMALYDLVKTDPQIKAEFDRANVVFIANYTTGQVQLICKGEPVTSLDGLKGKKVRYIGDYGKLFSAFGATTVAVPLPEVYQALDTGLVDCSVTYGYTILSYKLEEVSDNLLEMGWGAVQANGILMNKQQFDALDPKDQDILIKLGEEFTERMAKAIKAANRDVLDKLPEGINGHKVAVTKLPEADMARLDAEGDKLVSAWAENAKKYNLDGAALVQRYKDLMAARAAKQ